MIISAQTLNNIRPLVPFHQKTQYEGVSFGLSAAGYDIRIAQTLIMAPGEYRLASSVERFKMPENLLGVVHDKSTWARRGLTVQNTVIEPGWEGYLTFELANHNGWSLIDCLTCRRQRGRIHIPFGVGIAQVVFHMLDYKTYRPYDGKYQDQPPYPVGALNYPGVPDQPIRDY